LVVIALLIVLIGQIVSLIRVSGGVGTAKAGVLVMPASADSSFCAGA
jgi:hypothetical protein